MNDLLDSLDHVTIITKNLTETINFLYKYTRYGN